MESTPRAEESPPVCGKKWDSDINGAVLIVKKC